MKLVPGEIIPVYCESLLLFTSFRRDEISSQDELIPVKKTDKNSSRDEEKKKRRVNTSSQDEIFK